MGMEREPLDAVPATSPELQSILGELSEREPIFHRAEYGTTRADFEKMTAEDFRETGASGRIYSRRFVLLMSWRNASPFRTKTCGKRATLSVDGWRGICIYSP